MYSIGHPIFFEPYHLSRIDDKAHHSRSDFIEFPLGKFTNLTEVEQAEGVLYERMKTQYLEDIDRLRSLSRTLVGDIYKGDINDFYQKIKDGLIGSSHKFSSVVVFRDTRYQLHQLVNRIESFLNCHELWWTPLMSAARYGHADCLEQLLQRSTKSLNKQNKSGATDLMMAAKSGNIACLSVLLAQKGVHAYLCNNLGMTALKLAASHVHVACVNYSGSRKFGPI